MSSKSAFLALLFDKDQITCFSNTPKGTALRKYPHAEDLFFCINALHATADLNPTLEYHAADKPRRADHNIVCFRNFLIEIDNMPLDEQLKLIEGRKLPISSITYSGGKSYHFIISLDSPLDNAKEYKQVARQIYALIPESDPTQKNPSRLSRLPGAERPDTKRVQELKYLGSRVKFADLMSVLPKVSEQSEEREFSNSTGRFFPADLLWNCYNPDDTMATIGIKGRNHFFYWLGCRLDEIECDCETRKMFVERAYNYLQNKNGFSLQEALMAARV